MKRLAIVAVMVYLGVAAVYPQARPVKMTFSGTSAPSTIDLQQPDTRNDEDNFAGNGTLGSFTLRDVRAIANSPTPSDTCSGPNLLYVTESAGGGVFRFQDGSLLILRLTQGSDCIDFAAVKAHCTVTFEITGGTGRFKNASGTLTFTETVVPVLAVGSGNPVLSAASGEFEGTVHGMAREEEAQGEQQ